MKRKRSKQRGAVLMPRIQPTQQRLADKLAEDLAPLLKLRALRGLAYSDMKAVLFTAFDHAVIVPALNRHDRNITDTAESLGMPRQSLQVIMRKRGFKGAPRGAKR